MFENIVEQKKVKEILEQAMNKQQISHSYIFSGPRGTQKGQMAKEFAKILFCREEKSPCNLCVSCKKMNNGNHPDFIEIFPDKAHVGVEQIRNIRQDILIKPYEGLHKICVIHHAETMTIGGQNALLKTLEEPPAYAVIILLTDNVESLVPTIISRSQVLPFYRISQGSMEKYLCQKMGIEEGKAREIATFANGSLKKALDLLGQEDVFSHKQTLLQYILGIIQGDRIGVFTTAQWMKENKEKVEEWLDFLMLWFRDVLLWKEVGNNPWIVHRQYHNLLRDFSHCLSDKQIHDIIEEINSSKNNLKTNANLQLNMETMLLKMQEGSNGKGSRSTF